MGIKDKIINDCYMDRAQYIFGERITVIVTLSQWPQKKPSLELYNLNEKVSFEYTVSQSVNEKFQLLLSPGELPAGSYGVEVIIDGEHASTAFDVVLHYRDAFRYGFLSNFSGEDKDTDDVDWMRRLHLNTVQFYDWMYKHDDLIAPSNSYKEPLGREMCLDVITKKIQACKKYGIRPFAYGAVYAANKELFEQHPEWALYTMDGQPMTFFEWLNFMNVSEDCPWSKYIIAEFTKAMTLLGFSGIHMDTYGFPKTVWNSAGKLVSLADGFSKLIDTAAEAAKSIDSENGVIFNAVNNWPVESIAQSKQDAVYIEVWPPHDTYFDLYTLIREARYLSGKNVVLAAYMKPFKDTKAESEYTCAEISFLLANAVISASGGTQLVLGEYCCILYDSYYATHARLRESFISKVRNYSDFLVRYAPLLYGDDGMDVSKTATNGIHSDIRFSSADIDFSSDGKPGSVWTIIRESDKRLTIHFINLAGNDAKWNEPKTDPCIIKEIEIQILQDREIKGVWVASADDQDIKAKKLAFETEKTSMGRNHTLKLPSLHIWSTLWLEMK